jgi:hypothetical protein
MKVVDARLRGHDGFWVAVVRFGVLLVSHDAGLRRHDGIGEQVALTRTSTARGLRAGGEV